MLSSAGLQMMMDAGLWRFKRRNLLLVVGAVGVGFAFAVVAVRPAAKEMAFILAAGAVLGVCFVYPLYRVMRDAMAGLIVRNTLERMRLGEPYDRRIFLLACERFPEDTELRSLAAGAMTGEQTRVILARRSRLGSTVRGNAALRRVQILRWIPKLLLACVLLRLAIALIKMVAKP